ncbi:hypothetical protein [Actinomadura rupiterrae]|uniref:hypothetical protein n=1 Tax=Actinomadura rupiterrae TaxID=559627 RepID=UPI0020A36673|nr:hypothetical protein [Actinomadura rupiterrae]MCP2336121.1 hypothetical protein [Actinomadura rupiterrae]
MNAESREAFALTLKDFIRIRTAHGSDAALMFVRLVDAVLHEVIDEDEFFELALPITERGDCQAAAARLPEPIRT